MKQPVKLLYIAILARLAEAFAWLVLIVVSAVLVGYASHSPSLISLTPAFQGMSVLTALGLGCVALTLTLPRGATCLLAWSAAVLAVAALLSHVALARDAISPLVAQAVFGMPPEQSGHTSIATATGICFVAAAQIQRLHRHHVTADVLSAAVMILAGVALLGYAYGVRDLYAIFLFDTMALHTAAALFLLGLATTFAQADCGWARTIASSRNGGGATRRQLAFTLLPPIAGGLLLRLTNAGATGPGVAMALLVAITIVPLIALIVRDGQRLDALDLERETRDRLTTRTAADLRVQLAAQASALQHESAERGRAEAAMYRAQRLEAIGQLTGGIAHDFNNLLMAISGHLYLAQSRLATTDPARKYVDNAVLATQHGAKLSGQLLAFSRTQRLDIRPVRLDDLVQEAHELFGNALGPKISIELGLQSPDAWVLADADQLHLAIVNLALNARDAMPTGGAFRICTFVGATNSGGPGGKQSSFATIRVSDTGTGMSPEVLDRALEPFFTTKERGKGTGLGLAQVYGVVKQSGGDLHIASAPGQGTTIDILLPLTAAVSAIELHLEPAAQSVTAATDSGSLLVIDDDDLVRSALAEMLRSAGYEVAEAENGMAALRQLDKFKPALAIIDFIMPGINGAEVARRTRVKLPALPIIFVSGYADTVALDEIGNAIVLRKPVKPEILLDSVVKALHSGADRSPE